MGSYARAVRALSLCVAVLALAGCSGGDDDAAPTSPTTTASGSTSTPTETGGEATMTPLRVYFVRLERMGVAGREVQSTPAVGAAALRELLAGPTAEDQAADLQSEIPTGTKLNGLTIDNGVATVDLSKAFESGGGSTSMQLRVAQVVYTLTQFPSVKRVQFKIDGKPVEAIGGEGVVVDPPVGRNAFEKQTPAILVESPTPGSVVTSPLRVRGTSNTFEANLNLRLLDGSGKVLYDNFTTATSGSGTRGTFEQTIPFTISKDGPGTLVAYERSAADGSEINVVRIPVELRR
jgi:Sporulation and spore germination/Immunoglobulin-like domain of bacterial spore germination